MSQETTLPLERSQSRIAAIWFWFRTTCFRARQLLRSHASGVRKLNQHGEGDSIWPVTGRSRSLLYMSGTAAEFTLEAGKIQNLRCALQHMRRVRVAPGIVFSFWAQVGHPSRRRGFVHGRELREGCIIPSIGGGLCQLSNAIYDAALQAGLEIVERHGHTQRVPGSMAETGRDATVFWNYVDLKLRASFPWLLEASIQGGELVVEIRAEKLPVVPVAAPPVPAGNHEVESCESCGMVRCFRHGEMQGLASQGRTAWLVDAWWPEHDSWAQEKRKPADWLLLPMRGSRYPWDTKGRARVRTFPWFVLQRSWNSRRLAAQGAERQRTLLKFDEALAALYEKALPFDAVHLVVSQNLLPFLQRSGVLAGRTYDVLMQRWPLEELQRRLDIAAQAHPKSPTLADFRAPGWLVKAEAEALAEAGEWITPHRGVAVLAGKRARLLDWRLPAPRTTVDPQDDTRKRKPQLIFPASTLGRKGAWELRDAARAIGARVVLGGAALESPDFWQGIETIPAGASWTSHSGPVVLPAWIEHQPRRLLQAMADGKKVIASEDCGLTGLAGVTTIPTGGVDALISALKAAG